MAESRANAPIAITLPDDALVLLIGASGSGKSTFAARHFPAAAIASSDALRRDLAGDESDQRINEAVFDQLRRSVALRLKAAHFTVVDATNVNWMDRARWLELSREHGRPAVAIVLDLPVDICVRHMASRSRAVRPAVVRRQVEELHAAWAGFELEGYAAVHVLRSPAEVDRTQVAVVRSQASA